MPPSRTNNPITRSPANNVQGTDEPPSYIEVNQNMQINLQSQLDILPPTYPAMKLSTLLNDNITQATNVNQNNNNNSMLTNGVSNEDPVIPTINYDNVVLSVLPDNDIPVEK